MATVYQTHGRLGRWTAAMASRRSPGSPESAAAAASQPGSTDPIRPSSMAQHAPSEPEWRG